jgi:restriction system protein
VTNISAHCSHERALKRAHLSATSAVKRELLQRVQSLPSGTFEKLVIRLLIQLRYGCRGELTGKSGDAGIDGIINEDLLGFSQIYIQAKRWTSKVGRPEVQKFYGALLGRAATKGVLITASSFTKQACDYVLSLSPKVVLIDGQQLVELMYDSNCGVIPAATFELKRLTDEFMLE